MSLRHYHGLSPLLFILSLLILSSCVSHPEKPSAQVPPAYPDSPAWLWHSGPEEGRLVFVGAGPRRGNRDEEAFSALEDAALQAGVYSGFWGASQDLVLSSSAGTDWNTRTRVRYDGPASDRAKQEMDAREIWRTGEATWIRFTLDLPGISVISLETDFSGGMPGWIRRPPQIPGYITSVGSGGRRSTLAGTIKGADVGALAAMVDNLHGANRAVNVSRETGGSYGSSSSGASASYDRGFGEVRGFLVIARWVDGKGTAWSLAVCPE
jgi:hypothetical protein